MTGPECSVFMTDDEHLARNEVLKGISSLSMFIPEGEGDIVERIFCSDPTIIDILSDRSGFCLDRRMGELLVFSSEMRDTDALEELRVILPPFETKRRFLYAGMTNYDDSQDTFCIGMI